MADGKHGGASGPGDAPPTMNEYKKAQTRVRELIEKRKLLERRLVGYLRHRTRASILTR